MKRGALLWVVTAGVVEYSPVGALFSCFLFHYFHDALLSNYGQDRYNELPVQKVNITIVSCKILSLLTQLPTTIIQQVFSLFFSTEECRSCAAAGYAVETNSY